MSPHPAVRNLLALTVGLSGLLTCLPSAPGADPAAVVDVIIVAGQSNAVGYDADPQLLADDERDQQVRFWFRCGDPPPDEFDSRSAGWTTLSPQQRGNPDTTPGRARQYGNFALPQGGFGPEIGLARGVLDRQPLQKLAIIKVAYSGTSLLHDWNHAGNENQSSCYRALITEVRAALQAAAEQGWTGRIRGFVWVQGESDARPDGAETYRQALQAMLEQLRQELAAPEMLALVGVNTRFNGVAAITPAMQAIIDGQRAAAEADPLCRYVDLDGATLANPYHFDTAGTLEIGRRMGVAWLRGTGQLPERQKKALFIGIDGCRPDALAVAKTPHLDELAQQGTYFEATDIRSERDVDQADTVSGPGWSNLLTGVWPDKHNVLDNGFTEPHYDRYPHFFSRIKTARPQAVTASFSNWEPIATKIVQSADINQHFEPGERYIAGDAAATTACVEHLQTADPTVVFLYLGQVDETGHKYGFHPSVPEYVEAIERVDGHVGEVLRSLRSRSKFAEEDWVITVGTDHGGQGTGHGGGKTIPEIRQTFLIVSGEHAQRGRSNIPTYQVDHVATILAHLGIPLDPSWELDGRPIGLLRD
jgi:hypothetical protein